MTRRRHSNAMSLARAAACAAIASGLAGVSAQLRPLAVDPVIGHWDTLHEAGETMVIADARKWKTEPAPGPFPRALIRT